MKKSIIVTVEDPAHTDQVANALEGWGMAIKWKLSVVGSITGVVEESAIPHLQKHIPGIKDIGDDSDVFIQLD